MDSRTWVSDTRLIYEPKASISAGLGNIATCRYDGDGVEIRHYLNAVDGLDLLFDTVHYYPYGDNYLAET